jgi:hypothetical protein
MMPAVSHVALDRVASRLNKLKNPNREKYLRYLCEAVLDILPALGVATEPVLSFLRDEQPDFTGKVKELVDGQVKRRRDEMMRARDAALFQADNIAPETVKKVLKLGEDLAKDFAEKESAFRNEAELKYRLVEFLEQQFEAILESRTVAREQAAVASRMN